jgi:hypothetical protein
MKNYIALAATTFITLPLYAAEPASKSASPQLHKAEPAGAKAQMKKVEPCCGVTAVNAATGVVTMKDAKTGQTFNVTVQNKSKLNAIRVGQRVDKNL